MFGLISDYKKDGTSMIKKGDDIDYCEYNDQCYINTLIKGQSIRTNDYSL